MLGGLVLVQNVDEARHVHGQLNPLNDLLVDRDVVEDDPRSVVLVVQLQVLHEVQFEGDAQFAQLKAQLFQEFILVSKRHQRCYRTLYSRNDIVT